MPISPQDMPAKELERFAHAAYVSIRDRIVSLDIAPGALLSENMLGAELGLSRTPIREALRRLEREYLLSILPRRGIVVSEIQLHGQLQLVEFRRGIEARLISRGTLRASSDQRRQIAALAERLRLCAEANDLANHIRIDAEFDTLIEAAADNPYMVDAMRPIHALVRRYWHTQKGRDGLRQALLLHVRVVEASGQGDEVAVRVALNALYDYNEDYLVGQLGLSPRSNAAVSG